MPRVSSAGETYIAIRSTIIYTAFFRRHDTAPLFPWAHVSALKKWKNCSEERRRLSQLLLAAAFYSRRTNPLLLLLLLLQLVYVRAILFSLSVFYFASIGAFLLSLAAAAELSCTQTRH